MFKRTSTTCNAAEKSTLNSHGDSTQPCRNPCVSSNHSECSPSSVRTRARMPSWKMRVILSILVATPERVSTSHSSSRLAESYAFCRSMKHTYTGVSLCRPNSCNRGTTNSMSIVGRKGRKPHYCSSRSIPSVSQQLLRRDATIFKNILPEWATSKIPL